MPRDDQPSVAAEFEALAERLEAQGDYRVLRRLEAVSLTPAAVDIAAEAVGRAVFVDVETTGLDASADEIIELAMVPFRFRKADGAVLAVEPAFQGLQEPSRPLSPEIVALTGLTDADLAGQRLDMAAARAMVGAADLLIAHNAGFDRPFLEALDPLFANAFWACSLEEVDWRGAGFEGRGLKPLALQSGFFFDGHRAANDCLAGIELLARPLPGADAPAMAQLLQSARAKTWRLWALDSPYEAKDALKARGYRWNGAAPKAWRIDLASDAALAEEAEYLRGAVYRRDATVLLDAVSAKARYSAQPPRNRRRVTLSSLERRRAA